ncbi:Pentatricopeptide repeat (PPR) superfamily protein [Rhynchospora pubera]|uniref:Pentatricopeptide repeat (PPR) superfamily protein n=1 Tax=Rhynchospora pubera TaxID=906938 RepID=A0AAV8BQG6_9POAL|nr:Pentatricopeptide repeat (PPR) superfamily protein [Rhynchospora pubera]KAJ4801505.1 Pentatricopeptide repeat (PPR) superfamily protein [Rhynchospora pubera]
MAELSFKSWPRMFLLDQTTASPSSRAVVVAVMRHNQSNDVKSIKLRRPAIKEHHLWKRRDRAQSFQKASELVRIIRNLPDEKNAIYGALDRWTAFQDEFPIIAIAKSLQILKKNRLWLRIIQVCKWLFSKGRILTWSTYDALLIAFNMEGRVDEAELVYNKVIKDYTRSTPKRLFSRMISMYDYHHLPHKILEVFADMEEFGICPDSDTTWRIGRALVKLNQPEKVKQLLEKYLTKWKYLYFDGKRVRVKRGGPSDPFADQSKIDQPKFDQLKIE